MSTRIEDPSGTPSRIGTAIRLEEVTKTHMRGETEVHALRGISATIEPGSFTFILGPSGSGKSTLLYLIGALDTISSGSIVVNDQPLETLATRERDRYRRDDVGFIFQNFNLLGTSTALENVLVPYIPQGITADLKERAKELLTQVGLADRITHRPSHLSGGEQQRVAIARALLKKPKLVLADEPTGELDSQTGREIFSHLRKLHQTENATVVVVTHDSSYIEPQDRILRLRDGLVDHEG